ncbi:hypothetical protein SAMN04488134_11046 [Amphibacillus marinus]|uniref:DUF4350 domain-containing protein n=1 Tax=Amphibacillus marinus TaxID=872970 RepID=A0A1H8RD50_9BACI|nr:DUF4350 domain-containing protein [Amphibacillus marinus]SEO64331.1 hypothetical protein SAMN04488134_11046 [Amphibacillus marinus]
MKNWLANKRSIILFLVLFLVLLIGSVLLTEEPLENYPAFDVSSPSPTGVKAFVEALQESGFQVERLARDIAYLENESLTNDAIIMIEPSFQVDEQVKNAYTQYLDSGGTIYFFGTEPTAFFEVETHPIDQFSDETVVEGAMGQFEAEVYGWERIEATEEDQVILTDEQGILAIERQYQNGGKLVVVVEPVWLTNQAILIDDHLDILMGIINFHQHHQVWFDTFQYGNYYQPRFDQIYPAPFLAVAIGLLILSTLWLWMSGKRFGVARDRRDQVVRFGDERIRAIANWQIKGKNYQQALIIQVHYLKQLIFERTGTPVTASWSTYQQVLERLLPEKTNKSISDFNNQLQAQLNKEHATKQEFVEWTKRIDQIRGEVEQT